MRIHRNFHNLAFIISHMSALAEFVKSMLILSMITLIFSVLQGCSKHPQDSGFTEVTGKASVKFAVQNIKKSQTHSIDALVFNDDPLQRLDCYQYFEDTIEGEQLIGSCSGDKILLLCANLCWEKDSWREYNSFKKAGAIKVNLEDEDIEYPIMSSYAYIKAGEAADIALERLSSEIELRSIRSDFSGKPYDGEPITDAKVYLININASCSLLPQQDELLERIINHGCLIDSDMESLNDKNMIFSTLEDINENLQIAEAILTCFPNTSSEESIGSPFTKLVIEGKIHGETWFWPLDINRADAGTGIERNCRYIFDVTIRSKGTKDPNTTITPEMTDIIFETETWKEKEAYCVSF